MLEYATLAWNTVGAVLLLAAAVRAESVALAGFGLDSLIEIAASAVVVWQLRGDASVKRERIALRLIGISFLALALYLTAQSAYSLATTSKPGGSWLGVAWLLATVAVMLALAFSKLRVGKAIGNRVLAREAHVTLIDAYVAAAVLAGVSANTALGWWWADPLAGLAIVVYAIREGRLTPREAALDNPS